MPLDIVEFMMVDEFTATPPSISEFVIFESKTVVSVILDQDISEIVTVAFVILESDIVELSVSLYELVVSFMREFWSVESTHTKSTK